MYSRYGNVRLIHQKYMQYMEDLGVRLRQQDTCKTWKLTTIAFEFHKLSRQAMKLQCGKVLVNRIQSSRHRAAGELTTTSRFIETKEITSNKSAIFPNQLAL